MENEVIVIDKEKEHKERGKWWRMILNELNAFGLRADRWGTFNGKGGMYSYPKKKSWWHTFYNNRLDGHIEMWANGRFVLMLNDKKKLEFYKRILSKSKASWSIEI